MVNMTKHTQVLILVVLLAAEVLTRRVIRPAPGIETTGHYMVVLTTETSHERFEAIAEKVRTHSLSSEIHKIESPFAKMVVTKLSVDEAHKASLKKKYYIYIYLSIYLSIYLYILCVALCYTMV